MKNKWMKRLVCVLLVVCVMSSGIVGLADELEREFKSIMVGALDKTSSEWYYSDDETHAIFIALVTLDLLTAYADDEAVEEVSSIMACAIGGEGVYIAKDGTILSSYMFGEDKMLLYSYSAISEECASGVIEYSVSPIILMEALCSNNSDMVYESVDGELVLKAMEAIQEGMESMR